jgi:signal peptide peptidase SppA
MDKYALLKHLPFERFKSPPPRVAVLRLTGVIGSMGPMRRGLTMAGLAPFIERAFKLPRLEAVALTINSPGGSPVQSALIARRIRDLAAEKEVPVLGFCEDVAASGGYWLACAADEIFVQPSSIIGSIGVISAGFGFPALLERYGIERRVHTAGDKKSILDPFKAEDPKEVARLKSLQKEIHRDFIAAVKDRRGTRLTGKDATLFSGEFWSGAKAIELGLVDGEGELRHTLRQRYGEKVEMKVIEDGRPWIKRRLGLLAPGDFGAAQPADWAGGLLAAAEERALWARYGL